MTAEEFQGRLRALYDASLAATRATRRAQDEGVQALFDEVDMLPAETIGAIVNAEMIRFAVLLRDLDAEGLRDG